METKNHVWLLHNDIWHYVYGHEKDARHAFLEAVKGIEQSDIVQYCDEEDMHICIYKNDDGASFTSYKSIWYNKMDVL